MEQLYTSLILVFTMLYSILGLGIIGCYYEINKLKKKLVFLDTNNASDEKKDTTTKGGNEK